MTQEEAQKRYADAAHARQSAVAFMIELGGEAAKAMTPKHIRVGVDSAMVDHAALAALLIAKEVITEEAYREAIIAGQERETAEWTQRAREASGIPGLSFG